MKAQTSKHLVARPLMISLGEVRNVRTMDSKFLVVPCSRHYFFRLMIDTTFFNTKREGVVENTCDKEAKIMSQGNVKLTLQEPCGNLPKIKNHYQHFRCLKKTLECFSFQISVWWNLRKDICNMRHIKHANSKDINLTYWISIQFGDWTIRKGWFDKPSHCQAVRRAWGKLLWSDQKSKQARPQKIVIRSTACNLSILLDGKHRRSISYIHRTVPCISRLKNRWCL